MRNFDPMIGVTVDGYAIRRWLARGSSASVYMAEDVDGQRVVLKLILPDASEDDDFRYRFERESRLLASLDHPNVVPVVASGVAHGRLYLVERFIDGPDLRTLLDETGAGLTPERTVPILTQVADALDAVHAAGIIHRDIKPGNILLEGQHGSDHAWLADFGLARDTGSASLHTQAGSAYGTAAYMAPEVIGGDLLDPRSDVYAFGCLLYECLAGVGPFARSGLMATIDAQLSEQPEPLSGVNQNLPSAIDDVLARALAKTVDQRSPTAGAVMAEAASALGC